MSNDVANYDISKTYRNVVLTLVSGEPDTDGIPVPFIPAQRTGNTTLRAQGKLQDGFGTETPLILSRNIIEVEAEPISAYSVIRRCDAVNLYASSFINNLLWS